MTSTKEGRSKHIRQLQTTTGIPTQGHNLKQQNIRVNKVEFMMSVEMVNQ